MSKPFVLPPLPNRERPTWEQRLDNFLIKAALEPRPWFQAILWWGLRKAASFLIFLGHTFPLAYRPWVWLSRLGTYLLDQRTRETAKSMFLRRLFSLRKPIERTFRPSYVIVNLLTLVLLLPLVDDVIDGVYAYSTYGTYHNVVVTEAYRNITDHSTFAVHGYQIQPNGEKRELYFELRPNIWYLQLYVEFQFGQIPLLGRCNFDTYGILVRIPRRLRMWSAGSMYALNPNIIDLECVAPDIVPPAIREDHHAQ